MLLFWSGESFQLANLPLKESDTQLPLDGVIVKSSLVVVAYGLQGHFYLETLYP